MKKLSLSFCLLSIAYCSFSQNIGIGTATPQSKLHIISDGSEVIRLDATNQPYLSLYQSGVYKGYFWNGPNSIEVGSAPGSNLPVTLAPDGLQRLIVTPQGNVGIGIMNPNAPLCFSNSNGKKITLFSGSTGDAGMGTSDNRLFISSDNLNSDIAFGYDQSNTFIEKITMKGDGRLGIGTSNPSEKLEVLGNVKAQAYKYAVPKTCYYSIPPSDFKAIYSTDPVYSDATTVFLNTYSASASALVAPVHLPDGVIVSSVKVYYIDNSSNRDFTCVLEVKEHAEPHYPGHYGEIWWASGAPGNTSITSNPFNLSVNNQFYNYSMLFFTNNGAWPGSEIQILSVVLTYTMNQTL